MSTPKIPDLKGVTVMTPLEMNEVRFDKKHTILTPEVLEGINRQASTTVSDNRNALDSLKA